MSLGAVLVVGNWIESPSAEEKLDLPLARFEFLGQSALELTIKHLRAAQVNDISVVIQDHCSASLSGLRGPNLRVKVVKRSIDPSVVEAILRQQAAQGMGTLMLMRLGAYVEADFADLLDFHREMGRPLTRAYDCDGLLDLWVLDAGLRHALNIDSLLKDNLIRSSYGVDGYVNRLAGMKDFRRLVSDSFMGFSTIRPRGREVRPGVWVGDGAHVHRSARVVAPAYIGEGTRIRESVLLTRGSNVERQCEISSGTAVESASILPRTFLGRGLAVTKALVDGDSYVHLGRNLAVKIEDKRLIGRTTVSGWPFIRNANSGHHEFRRNGRNQLRDWGSRGQTLDLIEGAGMTTRRPVIIQELPERLTRGEVRPFLLEVKDHLDGDRPRLVFDFSRVCQIDSSGIEALLYCMEEVMKRDGDLKLAAVPAKQLMILELTRVDRLFETFETASEAVESFHHFPIRSRRHKQQPWYSQTGNDETAEGFKMAV